MTMSIGKRIIWGLCAINQVGLGDLTQQLKWKGLNRDEFIVLFNNNLSVEWVTTLNNQIDLNFNAIFDIKRKIINFFTDFQMLI